MNEYKDMVLGLAKDGEKVKKDITPAEIHMWHMATGIMGETVELMSAILNADEKNVLEELGDLLFYSVGYSKVADIPFSIKFNSKRDFIELKTILESSGQILDSTKKICIYKKRDVPNMEPDFLVISDFIYQTCNTYGFTIDQVREENKKKLGKRYPNLVYSDKMAQERNDKNKYLP